MNPKSAETLLLADELVIFLEKNKAAYPVASAAFAVILSNYFAEKKNPKLEFKRFTELLEALTDLEIYIDKMQGKNDELQ